jgi:hypothetical protein
MTAKWRALVSRSSIKSAKRQIRVETFKVREFLNEWAPMPDSPEDEYDCLVERIVSAMHRRINTAALADLIQAEFHAHFGLDVEREAALKTAHRIGAWWEQR